MASAGIRGGEDPVDASLALPVHRQRGEAAASAALPVTTTAPDLDPRERKARLATLATQITAVQSQQMPQSQEVQQSQNMESQKVEGAGGHTSSRDQIAVAKAICLRLLAVAPRPRAGLAQALARKEIPDDIARTVLDRLTEVGLIDDAAYAQSFVRIKHRDRALGRSALRLELRKLGVDEEVMAAAVETVDSSAERTRAAELIDKRVDAAMAAGPVAARRRLLGLLSRRGYSPEVAVHVVDHAIGDHCEGAEDWS